MNKQFLAFLFLILFCFLPLVSAATLKGSVYNSKLDLESDILIEINTTPIQKLLSKDGKYEFNVPPGEYILTARKGLVEVSEVTKVVNDGVFIVDLFLLPDFTAEDELWLAAGEQIGEDPLAEPETAGDEWWRYALVILILSVLGWRYAKLRKKYGSLPSFRRKMNAEHAKTLEQHKQEIAQEPGYLEEVLSTIQKHDGRISQKQLRSEMLHLSEAKISLILTELEHKGKIEKIKKGRGNVIVMK
ncbi:hypothetical protein HY495_03100 [Candidatus Woesearchaeota archaeon]|nr:hypothetical protein [Candidatus Woesearchaeota archaeon]